MLCTPLSCFEFVVCFMIILCHASKLPKLVIEFCVTCLHVIYSKTAIPAVKRCSQVWQPYTKWLGWKVVKSRWRPSVMVGLSQIFQFRSWSICVLISASLGNSTKFTRIIIKIFCHRPTITAISWPPPGFHNFFILAILCRGCHTWPHPFLQLEWLFLSRHYFFL